MWLYKNYYFLKYKFYVQLKKLFDGCPEIVGIHHSFNYNNLDNSTLYISLCLYIYISSLRNSKKKTTRSNHVVNWTISTDKSINCKNKHA